MAITWLSNEATRKMGHSGPLFFMIASKPATVELLDQIERELTAVGEKHGPVSFLMVIRPTSADRVSPEARVRLGQMLEKISPWCLAQAMVVEASGLFGTIVRTFIAGLSLITGNKSYPTKVFATTSEGLDWLASLPRQEGGFPTYRRDIEGYLAGLK